MSKTTLRHLLAAVGVIAATVLSVSTASASAGPTLSKQQLHSLKQACGYFSSDYTALLGIQKMANLTGAELKSAFRYVAGDLDGAKPPLGAADKSQLAQAAKILAEMSASTPSGSVSTSEKNRLIKRFRAAPFSTLNATVRLACRYLSRGKSG